MSEVDTKDPAPDPNRLVGPIVDPTVQNDDQPKLFKMLSDEEVAAAGLSTELTEADKQVPAPLVKPPETVVNQGIRSLPPRVLESGPPADPPPMPWERLPKRVRDEMEAGRALLGGGLSAKEAYEKATQPQPVVLGTTPNALFPDPEPPAKPLSTRTILEQEEGRKALRDRYGTQLTAVQHTAEVDAATLEANKPPTGDEMNYVAPERPPG